ncbi:MAG: L,D-transpeptidase family protein, partial [Acidobacteriota bacterium]|nr:L,D-transpeptidase family protein [Acidobacteriota bacterium]
MRLRAFLPGSLLVLLAVVSLSAARPRRRAVTPVKPRTPLAEQVENAGNVESVAPGTEGARTIRAQILLDRARFSPGEIDGRYGDDLGIAIKGFQDVHHMKVTGVIDADTWKLLNADTAPLIGMYTITEQDVKGPFAPVPKEATEQAQMKYLGYESAEEGLGEKFHSAPKLLAQLNPGKNLTTPGEEIQVPAISPHPPARALRVVVSKSKRTVTAFGLRDKVIAQYPATIGGEHDPLPLGHWTIANIEHNPWFYYDPVHFWNASPDAAAARLPPGPN